MFIKLKVKQNYTKNLFRVSYKVLSFDQFPMKSGILPVSSTSDAQLQQMNWDYFFPLKSISKKIFLCTSLILYTSKGNKHGHYVLTLPASFVDQQTSKESHH